METNAVRWGTARALLQALGLPVHPPARGTQGAEPARLLSVGTGVGGGMGMIIPAAGSALSPGRDPSAVAQGASSPSPVPGGRDAAPTGCLPWVGGLRWLLGR